MVFGYIIGLFPPNSRVTSLRCFAATAAIFLPVGTDPVKATLSTSLCATNAAPVLPSPHTKLKTPLGNLTCSFHFVSFCFVLFRFVLFFFIYFYFYFLFIFFFIFSFVFLFYYLFSNLVVLVTVLGLLLLIYHLLIFSPYLLHYFGEFNSRDRGQFRRL